LVEDGGVWGGVCGGVMKRLSKWERVMVRKEDCKLCRVGIKHPHSEVLRIKMEKGV